MDPFTTEPIQQPSIRIMVKHLNLDPAARRAPKNVTHPIKNKTGFFNWQHKTVSDSAWFGRNDYTSISKPVREEVVVRVRGKKN